MKIQPFGEKVAIKILKQEEVTESGLIMSVSSSKSNKGIVEAIGDEVKDYIHVGDIVIFNLGSGVSYTDGNEDYKILNIRDILGKIVGE